MTFSRDLDAGDLDAGALVGLLADDDRRLAFAALTLGARRLDDVVEATRLPVERTTRALTRLAAAGLVVPGQDGDLVAVGEAFQRAARVARARPRREEHADEPAARRRVLDVFVHGGRLASIPANRAKRLVVLDWIGQDFEPGRRYRESEVNALLAPRHSDTAALRRYLVDESILDRAGGEYWRSGGTVL